METFGTLLTAIIGTSATMVGGIAVASRFSKRVHIMLWGE